MKLMIFAFWFAYLCVSIIPAKHRSTILTLNRNYVCHIKKSCIECLKLVQCTWCEKENKCYSEELITQKGYCENGTVRHIEYGMSINDNAECACAGGNIEKNCVSPGAPKKEECSGPDRGTCICGRCFCNPKPDPHNLTKALMGEYCEYDNFSCNGAKCNEGPYNIYEENYGEEKEVIPEPNVTQPLEE